MNLYFYFVHLNNDKYYVLLFENNNLTLNNLYNNISPMPDWLLINAPIKVLDRIKYTGNFSLDDYVMLYMNKFGVDNVRGGTFSDVILSPEQKHKINIKMNSMCSKRHEVKNKTCYEIVCNMFTNKKDYEKPLLNLDSNEF